MGVPFLGRGKGGILLTSYGILLLEDMFYGVAKADI